VAIPGRIGKVRRVRTVDLAKLRGFGETVFINFFNQRGAL